jgi:uncharacterized protein YndB with AHSA1/START domain
MTTSVQSIHIDAPPEVAFAYMTDLTNVGELNRMSYTPIHETPDRVGSSYALEYREFGLPRRCIMVITEYVPGERVAFRASQPSDLSVVWRFVPADGGTDLTLEQSFRSAIPGFGPLYMRLMRLMFRVGMGPRTKARIERHAQEIAKAA